MPAVSAADEEIKEAKRVPFPRPQSAEAFVCANAFGLTPPGPPASRAHLLNDDLAMPGVIDGRPVLAEDAVVSVHRQVHLVDGRTVLHVVEQDETVVPAADGAQ